MKFFSLPLVLPSFAIAEPIRLLENLDAWMFKNGKPAKVAEGGWQLADGVLHRAGKAGDLLSKKQYGDFTLSFEWKIENWLNGVLVVSYDTASSEFEAAVAASKFAEVPQFGKNAIGHILVQDHGAPVWYRNMQISE